MNAWLDWPCVHTSVSTPVAPSSVPVTLAMSWGLMAGNATVSTACRPHLGGQEVGLLLQAGACALSLGTGGTKLEQSVLKTFTSRSGAGHPPTRIKHLV